MEQQIQSLKSSLSDTQNKLSQLQSQFHLEKVSLEGVLAEERVQFEEKLKHTYESGVIKGKEDGDAYILAAKDRERRIVESAKYNYCIFYFFNSERECRSLKIL